MPCPHTDAPANRAKATAIVSSPRVRAHRRGSNYGRDVPTTTFLRRSNHHRRTVLSLRISIAALALTAGLSGCDSETATARNVYHRCDHGDRHRSHVRHTECRQPGTAHRHDHIPRRRHGQRPGCPRRPPGPRRPAPHRRRPARTHHRRHQPRPGRRPMRDHHSESRCGRLGPHRRHYRAHHR